MMLNVKTHGGSIAVANPSFTLVSCPHHSAADESTCLFVSYFLFSEGAAEGEAGSWPFTSAFHRHRVSVIMTNTKIG